jgi:hypothetical protein
VELGRFATHGLTPAVLTAVELGKFAPHLLASEMFKLQGAASQRHNLSTRWSAKAAAISTLANHPLTAATVAAAASSDVRIIKYQPRIRSR